ncbi:MAG: hypothetical protein Q8907_11305 [Bacteroidota bacterium]|nr:hypothetical protein [Bacteroidota bacterium]
MHFPNKAIRPKPSISSDYNNDIIDRKINIGTVVSIDIAGIDHPKWNIILDLTDDKCLIASVFINSEINFKYINSHELRDLQYLIRKSDYDFLDHDSFIDCSKVFTEPYSKFKEALIRNAVRKKGELPASEVNKIYDLVRKSKNITGSTKKRFQRLFGTGE